MASAIFLFLALISISVFLFFYFDEPFEKTIPISLLSITYIMYLFGLFNVLFYGLIIIFFIAAGLYIAVAWLVVKKGGYKNIIGLITVPFLMFTFLFFVTIIANRGIRPHVWDEFSHWLFVAKIMCHEDALFTRVPYDFLNIDYPPGVTLFQYFYSRWIMLCRETDVFPVGASYAALQILQISFIFPLIRKGNAKGFFSVVMTIMLVFVFPLFFFSEVYRNGYVDSIFGILMGASIATVAITPVEEKNWTYHVLIVLECAFLVLTKRVGVLAAMCLGGAYLLDGLYTIRHDMRNKWKSLVAKILITFSAIILPFGLVQMEARKASHMIAQNASEVVSEAATPAITINPSSTKAFFEKLYTLKFDVGYTGIAIPYFLIPIIGFALIYFVYSLKTDCTKEERRRIAMHGWYGAFVIVAWIGAFYFLMIAVTENGALHSFNRYIPPCFMPISFIAIFGLYNYISGVDVTKKKYLSLCVILLLAIMVPIAEPIKFLDGSYKDVAYEYYSPLKTLCQKQEELELDEDDRIYFISQGETAFYFAQMRYYAYPSVFIHGPFWFSDGIPDEKAPNKLEDSVRMDAGSLMDTFKNSDVTHVMIFRTDEYFNKNYSSLFEPGVDIEESTIYTFSPSSGLLIKAK